MKLTEEELRLLLFVYNFSQEKEITEDWVLILADEIVRGTWLSYYQQMTMKKKLETKWLVKLKYRDIPRKLYIKLVQPAVDDYLNSLEK
jgi:hypothetical protein